MDPRPIITRAEAKAAGLAHYWTGKPCKHGHEEERRVINGNCTKCSMAKKPEYRARSREKDKASHAAWLAQNTEKVKTQTAAYRARNKAKMKEIYAEYYVQNKEEIKAKKAAYRIQNLEKLKAASAASRARHPEKVKARAAAWDKANPEKVRARNRNRRARRKAAEGNHTKEDVLRIYDAQKGKCACCKGKVGNSYHVDHIQPLSKGGSNWPSNLQILCPTCNGSKHNKDPIDHMRSLGMLL